MRVYSPSQTETFLFCPIKRQLEYQEGWRPAIVQRREVSAVLGRVLHAGIGEYYTQRKNGYLTIPDIIKSLCWYVNNEAGAELKDRVIPEEIQELLKSVYPKAEKTLGRFIENDPIPSDWTILDVEQKLSEAGNAIIDLALRDKAGPFILDWKVKDTFKEQYRYREVERWRHSWAMKHYIWHYGKVLNERIDRYYIGLIVCSPFRVELVQFVVHPEEMKAWEESAKVVWDLMEKCENGEMTPWQASVHETVFGPCEFKKACFEFFYDPTLMAREYARRER